MKPARFAYVAPASLPEALSLLEAHEDACIIAGGQSLVPMMNMRIAQPELLVDINRIAGLAGVALDGGRLVIGALTRHADLASNALVAQHAPVLAHAAGTIGHYAIRQRGTIGGSLAHADPAAQLPLVMTLLDAEIEVRSINGGRTIAAADFFETLFTTTLEPGEMVTAIRVPVLREGHGWGLKLFNRRAGDFAEVSAAALVIDGEDGKAVRLVLGSVVPAPMRADDMLPDFFEDAERWAAEAARSVAAQAPVEDNVRMPEDYRREVLQALVEDTLRDAMRRS